MEKEALKNTTKILNANSNTNTNTKFLMLILNTNTTKILKTSESDLARETTDKRPGRW